MGTIVERKKQDGKPSFTAQIRIRSQGVVIHSEAKTFASKQNAQRWLMKRETELDRDGLPQPKAEPITLREVLTRYLETPALYRDALRTKQCIERLRTSALADRNVYEIRAKDISQHILERLRTVQPQTIMSDVMYLHQALQTARVVWGLPIDLQHLMDAKVHAAKMGWISQSKRRFRRVTPEEIIQLTEWYRANQQQIIPMADIIEFAVASTRRVEEITLLRWEDLDEQKSVIKVRDVKHPRKKVGNTHTARLTPEGLAIIQRQPRTGTYIFPYNARSISNSFYRTTHLLGIQDLRFHDLRHEAITRLFERGYAIHEVALFSLHLSWNALNRYTHLRAEDLKEK